MVKDKLLLFSVAVSHQETFVVSARISLDDSLVTVVLVTAHLTVFFRVSTRFMQRSTDLT
jgi:hypothetical protein